MRDRLRMIGHGILLGDAGLSLHRARTLHGHLDRLHLSPLPPGQLLGCDVDENGKTT